MEEHFSNVIRAKVVGHATLKVGKNKYQYQISEISPILEGITFDDIRRADQLTEEEVKELKESLNVYYQVLNILKELSAYKSYGLNLMLKKNSSLIR